MGIGIGGGIHSIIWFEDCYLSKVSTMNVNLARIPETLLLLTGLFILEAFISTVLNKAGKIKFSNTFAN